MSIHSHKFSAAQPAMAATLSRLDTADLRALAAIAIDIIDARGGDCDMEDDDPAGDPLELFGEPQSDTGAPLYAALPIYDTDQTAGPINERDADLSYRAAEQGLIRSPNGGWRRAA